MPGFNPGQRVHHATDPTRTGTVHYTGPIQGHAGDWVGVGVDWDNEAGKQDGWVNRVRYFQAKGQKSGSFVRDGSLSGGVGVVEAVSRMMWNGENIVQSGGGTIAYAALKVDEMFVLSASNNRVSVQLVGKDKIQDKLSKFDELERVSLAYLGVSSAGPPNEISKIVPNLKELDLTGNLLSDWKDVGAICEELPALAALNLSNNLMSSDVLSLLPLKNLSVLVLNYTCIKWAQIESLKGSLVAIKELHLMGNQISEITLGAAASERE
ncbi:Tubulin-folding cofactor E-like protein [Drosera capensis]